jgi:hypothetical protein
VKVRSKIPQKRAKPRRKQNTPLGFARRWDDAPQPTATQVSQRKLGKAHMGRVAKLSCCILNKDCNGRVEVHHLIGLEHKGTAQRADDFHTIPLCHAHHNGGQHGIALHAGVETWETEYGTQEYHLACTRTKLRMVFRDWCPLTGVRVRG